MTRKRSVSLDLLFQLDNTAKQLENLREFNFELFSEIGRLIRIALPDENRSAKERLENATKGLNLDILVQSLRSTADDQIPLDVAYEKLRNYADALEQANIGMLIEQIEGLQQFLSELTRLVNDLYVTNRQSGCRLSLAA